MRLRRTQSRYLAGVSYEEWLEAGATLGRACLFLGAVVATLIALAVWT